MPNPVFLAANVVILMLILLYLVGCLCCNFNANLCLYFVGCLCCNFNANLCLYFVGCLQRIYIYIYRVYRTPLRQINKRRRGALSILYTYVYILWLPVSPFVVSIISIMVPVCVLILYLHSTVIYIFYY